MHPKPTSNLSLYKTWTQWHVVVNDERSNEYVYGTRAKAREGMRAIKRAGQKATLYRGDCTTTTRLTLIK